MKKKILVLGLTIIIASCASLSKTGTKQVSVVNTKWILTDNHFSSNKAPTLIIENNRVTGNGSCNNYFSDIVLNPQNGTFDVGDLGSTKMACDSMATEQNYFNLLEQVNKYIVNGDYLELYKDNLLLLKFKKQ